MDSKGNQSGDGYMIRSSVKVVNERIWSADVGWKTSKNRVGRTRQQQQDYCASVMSGQ